MNDCYAAKNELRNFSYKYITKPWNPSELDFVVVRALELITVKHDIL
jgi:hypothetical protein